MIVTKISFTNITCLLIMLGLTITYSRKQKDDGLENKYYMALLVVNIIGLIIHILSEYASYYYTPILSTIVFKCILLYYMIFTTLFMSYYLIALKLKKTYLYIKLNNLFCTVCCLLSIVTPEKFYGDNANLIFYTYGLDTKIAYLHGYVMIFFVIILLIAKYKTMDKKKKLYMLIYMIGLSIAGLIQKRWPEITTTIYVETILCCMMYFNIENPDVEVGVFNAAKTQAIKAGRAKEDFLSSMSHELRTPLNTIIGLSECIKTEDDVDDIHNDANDIVVASQDLLELVNSILNVNSIENNTLDLEESNYDLNKINKELVKMMDTRLYDKEVNLITNFSNDIPTTLYGDSYKLRTIITNLLSNAIKYTDRGIIEYNVSCINKNDICQLEITVKDTGRGISKEQQANLYSKFNRREEDKDSDIKGVGLGLAITKSLVDLMEGTIKVESEENVGTRFTVRIDQKIIEQNNVEVL